MNRASPPVDSTNSPCRIYAAHSVRTVRALAASFTSTGEFNRTAASTDQRRHGLGQFCGAVRPVRLHVPRPDANGSSELFGQSPLLSMSVGVNRGRRPFLPATHNRGFCALFASSAEVSALRPSSSRLARNASRRVAGGCGVRRTSEPSPA